MLDFQPLTLDMKAMIDGYTFKYGENSCQHSFVSSFCLNEKYGDMFCERDNFLYTLRSKKCRENERTYLFPLGDKSNLKNVKNAVENILLDSHKNNSTVKFETVTESSKDILKILFSEKFLVESSRDFAEHILLNEKLATYSGSDMAIQRWKYRRFLRSYGDKVSVTKINAGDIDALKEFQSEWLKLKMSKVDNPEQIRQLQNENDGVQVALNNFSRLGLTGIIVKIDGKIKGFSYGSRLSENCMDGIVEHCMKDIQKIHPFIKHEFSRLCCAGITYLNVEEDLGLPGLRTAKNDYKPELMKKFIVREVI